MSVNCSKGCGTPELVVDAWNDGTTWNDGSHGRTRGLDSAPNLPLFGLGGGSATSSTHRAPAKGEPPGSEPIFQEMQLGRKES